jgi:ribosomal protein S18 acetylase RimI-like enzyme
LSTVEIDIREIQPGDKLTGLSLGSPEFTPLKTFLQRKARKFHECGLGRTYVACVGNRVVAYITIVCGQIDADCQVKSKADADDYSYEHFPAVKIARLAVDKDYREANLGRKLVNLALGIVKDSICPKAGCRFVVVDSKASAVGFYKKCGFTFLDTEDNRTRPESIMFVDMHKISVADAPPEPVKAETFLKLVNDERPTADAA